MDSITQKFKSVFLEEAQEILNSYEAELLKLEKAPDNTEIIESAFRSMHTLKGISGMYGFEYVNEITHKLEFIFQSVRDKKQLFTKNLFEITFSVIDHIRKLLQDESLEDVALKDEHSRLMQTIEVCYSENEIKPLLTLKEENKKECIKKIWHIKLQTNESQFFRGISFMNIFRDLAEIGLFAIERQQSSKNSKTETWGVTLLTTENEEKIREIFMFVEDDCQFKPIAEIQENDLHQLISDPKTKHKKELSILESILTKPETKKETINKTDTSKNNHHDIKRISVSAEKLDHLMFLVSELITVNSQVSLSMKENNVNTLKSCVEKIDSLSKSFRNNALELRLVPLNDLVLRFQRLIRDLSNQLGKKVDFQISGADCELDKSTIEQLSDPLMHIIRNCLDHGIETPEQRKKHGKPETGILKLSAYHSGGKIVIEIKDDGNGVDLEKVRNKAISMGLITNETPITKKELLDFIFVPGFSTAQSLSNISGRGVGMDVVRKKIQELRGEVIVETQEKVGTSFILTLQQSVSIIDTLLFRVENSFFTLPISDIDVCSEIKMQELGFKAHTGTIPFRDQLITYTDLRKELLLEGLYPAKTKIVIIKINNQYLAILADKIIGEHQAVLKPITKTFKTSDFLCAVSQLGDGNMAYMIDTHELLKKNIEKTEINHLKQPL